MKPYGIIYKITNKTNGKVYVGQTKQELKDRLRQHRTERGSYPISNAIRKYGMDGFDVEVIDSATNPEELNKKEINYIRQFECLKPDGYNIRSGGNSSPMAESTKRLLAEKARLRPRKKRDTLKCLSTSVSRGGKTYTHQPKTSEIRKKSRMLVEGTNLQTGEVIIFESTLEAQKNGGFHRGKISECCRGKRKVHKLHTWRYL